ncbi:hypothetical protein PG988_009314 [Apiospora saccharicola]
MDNFMDNDQPAMDDFLNQDQDPSNGVDFDNGKADLEPTFFQTFASQQDPEVKLGSQEKDLNIQDIPLFGEQKLDIPADSTSLAQIEPQQLGNEWPHGDEMDVMQFQPPGFQEYMDPNLLSQQYPEPFNLTQNVVDTYKATSEVDGNLGIPHQSLPLSVDTTTAAAFDGDWPYDSDDSIPLSGQLPPTSPLDYPVNTIQVGEGQPHTIQRRGSTPLITHGKIKRTTRRNQGEQPMDPETLTYSYYGKPPPQKKAWGPRQKNGKPLFQYNRQGELDPNRPLSNKEIRMFLFGPSHGQEQSADWTNRDPEPGEVCRVNAGRSGLTLWISWTPAQSSHRYPSSNSNKCKFLDCALDSRTIKTGDPRIIFDERHNVTGASINPFWNAGYCHLYCFEKHFDPVQLLSTLDIRLDNRVFEKEESNLSALKPDEFEACKRWFHDHWPEHLNWHFEKYLRAKESRDEARKSPGTPLPPPAVERVRPWDSSLTYTLMKKSLDLESPAKAQQRAKRREVKKDSCDRDIHRGDLDYVNLARRIANQRVKSRNQGEVFQKEPPKVGTAWDDFQLARQQSQEQQWLKWTPVMSANSTWQSVRPAPHLPRPALCSSPSLSAKRPCQIESEPAPSGEDSRPTKRQRHSPIGEPSCAQAGNYMPRINGNPSQLGDPGAVPYVQQMQVSQPDVSQYSDQYSGATGFTESCQTDFEMPDMLPASGSVLGQGLPEPWPSFSPNMIRYRWQVQVQV